MAKYEKIDSAKLLKMIEEKVDPEKIKEEFKFRSLAQLKMAYANAAMEYGKITPLQKSTKETKRKTPNEITAKVNNKGALIITPTVMKNMKFEKGQIFRVKKTRDNIIQLKLKQNETGDKNGSQSEKADE